MTKNNKKNLKKVAKADAAQAVSRLLSQVNLKVQKSKMKKTSGNIRAGAITSVNTAPVSIGNSIKGSSNKVTNTQNGVRVIGRDFMFQPLGTTAAVSNWSTVGGCPLTPACFADSILANYMRMYSKFRFKSVVVHYITSSATSSTGDVMFYYNKDRQSVHLNQTSGNLLNFVLSDDNTILGPQWTNHSAQFRMGQDWKLCDYGMHSGLEEYADGDVFLLSKTTTTDSPGYVLFDYDIEFAEKNVAVRLTKFPMTNIIWTNTCVGLTTTALVAGSSNFYAQILGKSIDGNNGQLPGGNSLGSIYKVVFDVTNSLANAGNPAAWTNVTVNDLIKTTDGVALTITDGMTLYCRNVSGTTFNFYANAEAAFVNSGALYSGVTATVTYTLCCMMSYIGSSSSIALAPSF